MPEWLGSRLQSGARWFESDCDVGVVREHRAGRERYYSLSRDRLGEVERWLARLDGFWTSRLRRLGEHLDEYLDEHLDGRP